MSNAYYNFLPPVQKPNTRIDPFWYERNMRGIERGFERLPADINGGFTAGTWRYSQLVVDYSTEFNSFFAVGAMQYLEEYSVIDGEVQGFPPPTGLHMSVRYVNIQPVTLVTAPVIVLNKTTGSANFDADVWSALSRPSGTEYRQMDINTETIYDGVLQQFAPVPASPRFVLTSGGIHPPVFDAPVSIQRGGYTLARLVASRPIVAGEVLLGTQILLCNLAGTNASISPPFTGFTYQALSGAKVGKPAIFVRLN